MKLNKNKILKISFLVIVICVAIIIIKFINCKIIKYKNNESIEVLSKYGSRGNEVTTIQTKLKRWGYYKGSIDGIYGTQTMNAVKYFQRKNGLTQDRYCWTSYFKSNGNN